MTLSAMSACAQSRACSLLKTSGEHAGFGQRACSLLCRACTVSVHNPHAISDCDRRFAIRDSRSAIGAAMESMQSALEWLCMGMQLALQREHAVSSAELAVQVCARVSYVCCIPESHSAVCEDSILLANPARYVLSTPWPHSSPICKACPACAHAPQP